MSSNLYWEVVRPKGGKILSDATKFLLRRVFSEPINITLDGESAKFLRGVEAATESEEVRNELSDIIRALDAGETIKLEERY